MSKEPLIYSMIGATIITSIFFCGCYFISTLEAPTSVSLALAFRFQKQISSAFVIWVVSFILIKILIYFKSLIE